MVVESFVKIINLPFCAGEVIEGRGQVLIGGVFAKNDIPKFKTF